MPDNMPTGIPTRLVNPTSIRVPCIACPTPIVVVIKPKLNCGAPFLVTSNSILANGITAIITQIAHNIKDRLFLNFLKP